MTREIFIPHFRENVFIYLCCVPLIVTRNRKLKWEVVYSKGYGTAVKIFEIKLRIN